MSIESFSKAYTSPFTSPRRCSSSRHTITGISKSWISKTKQTFRGTGSNPELATPEVPSLSSISPLSKRGCHDYAGMVWSMPMSTTLYSTSATSWGTTGSVESTASIVRENLNSSLSSTCSGSGIYPEIEGKDIHKRAGGFRSKSFKKAHRTSLTFKARPSTSSFSSITRCKADGDLPKLARNEGWLVIQQLILGFFQKPQQAQHLWLEPHNAIISKLQLVYDERAIIDMYGLVICKGMIILREKIRNLNATDCICELAKIWTTFYTDTLTVLLSLFCVPNGGLFQSIRKNTIVAFRDHVVLSSVVTQQLENVLSQDKFSTDITNMHQINENDNEYDDHDGVMNINIAVPCKHTMDFLPRITQMLLVLQSIRTNDRYEREIQRLLSKLKPCIEQHTNESKHTFPVIEISSNNSLSPFLIHARPTSLPGSPPAAMNVSYTVPPRSPSRFSTYNTGATDPPLSPVGSDKSPKSKKFLQSSPFLFPFTYFGQARSQQHKD